MAQRVRKRKCRNCGDFFDPDHRNVLKQKYCKKPACRKASKAAAQARWLAKPKNKNYFRGTDNVRHVQEWRRRNPGYWRRKGRKPKSTLQDHFRENIIENQIVTSQLDEGTLQDFFISQHAVLIGLIAHLTGMTLQDDIFKTAGSLQKLGADILNSISQNYQGGDYVGQNPYPPWTNSPGP